MQRICSVTYWLPLKKQNENHCLPLKLATMSDTPLSVAVSHGHHSRNKQHNCIRTGQLLPPRLFPNQETSPLKNILPLFSYDTFIMPVQKHILYLKRSLFMYKDGCQQDLSSRIYTFVFVHGTNLPPPSVLKMGPSYARYQSN